jgi:NTP pyrophosphatase (non-canonical NTP hydrolase)
MADNLDITMNLKQLQDELKPWVLHNFGQRPSYQPLLGALEELGELAHAHLKQEQQIRTNEDHEANAKDAIADTIIYLADYCNTRGFDLGDILTQTWNKVKLRDWKRDPRFAGSGNVDDDAKQ